MVRKRYINQLAFFRYQEVTRRSPFLLRAKVMGCGPWLLVVIACKTCFTLIDHPEDLYPDGSCLLSGCVVETIRMCTLCQRRLLFLG
uniref:Uncharacterized protein n=1 Tax=Vitis vinifera TaxID=29760 RepID=A5AL92_VITVI|nr:hypothetical protein VITISV_013934 [Vitis vinifera]